jgi:hypothetical protein
MWSDPKMNCEDRAGVDAYRAWTVKRKPRSTYTLVFKYCDHLVSPERLPEAS